MSNETFIILKLALLFIGWFLAGLYIGIECF